jgi:hypothetical protein
MLLEGSFRRTVVGLLGVVTLSLGFIAPASASNTVTQVIDSGGGLSASIAAASMQSITYSNNAQSTNGTLTLSVSDPRGTSQGWTVTVQSTDFEFQGSGNANARSIPATGFVLATADAPTNVSGQPVDPASSHGPLVPAGALSQGALSSARTPVTAYPGFGSGDYSQDLHVTLAIPGQTQAGIYQAVLTVAITSGP